MSEVRVAKAEDVRALARINLEIQEIHAEKYPAIFKKNVIAQDIEKEFIEALAEDYNKIYVIVNNHEVIGYCWFRILSVPETSLFHAINKLSIIHFGVLKEFQGLGFGKTLMKKILNIGNEYRVAQIQVDSWSFNEAAISFYKNCGFELRSEILWINKHS